ncbi:hypothetical protein J3R83DRAFT_12141 [Lanmaoa asiatica]|nr:hypothetical protein J3R83DRAFT_12141 [Lanmaoa asiatica]
MSDVRTLLKAKRQEIRIDHPLASYTSSGQLRCVVCETNIKHPSAWDGHLGSKAHRTNAARIREEERRRKELELEEPKRLKRKAPEDDINGDIRSTAKKPKGTSAPQPSTFNLPPDFFSDPSRAPLLSFNDLDDEDEMGEAAAITKPTDGGGDPSLDQEWIQFQQSVINAPDAVATYDRATIFAEPELVSDPSEGFPAHDGVHAQPLTKADEDERRRKEQEERELIMDRLMAEERAQEEADMKVVTMKNKLEALRKRREASRSAKSNVGVV